MLTAEGEAVVELARPVLGLTMKLMEGAAELRGENSSRLIVSASLTVAEHLVPRWLVGLAARGVEVSVPADGNSSDVAAQVREGNGTTRIRRRRRHARRAPFPNSMQRRTDAGRRCRPSMGGGQPVSSVDLAATSMVLREGGSGTREVLEQWMAATGHRPHPVVEMASTTAMVQAVLAGVGPGVISGLAVRNELADGRLVRVPLTADPGMSASRVQSGFVDGSGPCGAVPVHPPQPPANSLPWLCMAARSRRLR